MLNLRPARVVRPGARRVPPPRAPRAARARRRASPTTTCSSARTATSSRSAPTAPSVERRAVPAGYMYVDGIVGDIGHGVLRDRRVLAEEGVVVVIVTVDSQHGRDRDRPRDRHPRLGVRARGRGPARGRASRPCATSIDGAARRRRDRLRDDAPPRPPFARPVHRRAHPPPPDRHPGRHGSLTAIGRLVTGLDIDLSGSHARS